MVKTDVGSTASRVWTGGLSKARISRMGRKPDDKHKIQAPSVPEVAAAFDTVFGSLRRKVSFQGNLLSRGALVNAMAIHFLSLDPEAQRSIVETGVARYEELLASDVEVEDWQLKASEPDPVVDPKRQGVRHVATRRLSRPNGDPAGPESVDPPADPPGRVKRGR